MFNLFQKQISEATKSTESKPLLNRNAIAAGAFVAADYVNESAEAVRKASAEGPLTFRMLGFLGGLAMIVSNGFAILERFFTLNVSGCLIAIYGFACGFLIVMLESPGTCSHSFRMTLRPQARFLFSTGGRGVFYLFVGSLQFANWSMLDWAVGGFMMFVGLTAVGVGFKAARDLKNLQFHIQDEGTLKKKWNEHDVDRDGFLDVKELTAFVRDANVKMSRNEVAAVFLALDKNFDDRISYPELLEWWKSARKHEPDRILIV